MKKPYCKPQIAFEDFELCANIAQGCTHSTNFSRGKCSYDIPGIGKLFFDNRAVCNIQVYTDGAYGLCYHIPMEMNCLFSS